LSGERKRVRCAIYTRKSSEEGLEQSFNSLHAQREACQAFIVSQRLEGWREIEANYDDGGYSGGSLERPAVKALLADIDAGKVDVVVVYKVDRLTRSLADFAKIVERFDARGVSFVSVTQQFNTASSMGRLTLNVLLSFAQFEREVTGERIRDKIAASKKKGMWTGGPVPLGYNLKEHKLVVNQDEAPIVRQIYRRYLELGCVRKLQAELEERGVLSKRRVSRLGRKSGGVPYSRGALYSILQNRLYLGQIAHRGALYAGQHPAIIDETLWQDVQTRLKANTVAKHTGARAAEPSLLAGLLYDDRGNRLIPSHCRKGGRRYRYYFSEATLGTGKGLGAVRRIPAAELEDLVRRRLSTFLLSSNDLVAQLGQTDDSAFTTKALTTAGQAKGTALPKSAVSDVRAFLLAVSVRVVISQEKITVPVARRSLRAKLLGAPPPAGMRPRSQADRPQSDEEDAVILTIDAKLSRLGSEIRLILPPEVIAERTKRLDEALIKAIARARSWYEKLLAGDVDSLATIAKQLRVHPRYVGRIFRCAFLAPSIVEAILEGRQPPQLTVEKLRLGAPVLWTDQHKRIGPLSIHG
jgi:DNA invertase Pin-like site-specific DNA recombinase